MITVFRTPLARTATLAGATGAAAVLAVAALTGAGAAAAATVTVPPIHETFTQSPCPANPSTTIDEEACAADKVLTLDAKIDKLDTAIVAMLPAAGQREFALAAKQWLTYRNTVAKAAGTPYTGGTIMPLIELGALATEDQAHITALDKEFTSLSGQKP